MASQQVLALLFKVRILTWDHTKTNLLEIQLCDTFAEVGVNFLEINIVLTLRQ